MFTEEENNYMLTVPSCFHPIAKIGLTIYIGLFGFLLLRTFYLDYLVYQ